MLSVRLYQSGQELLKVLADTVNLEKDEVRANDGTPVPYHRGYA